jgi:hypothetical protein
LALEGLGQGITALGQVGSESNFDRVEGSLRPGSLVIADDMHHCPDYVRRVRSDAHKYMSVPLAGNVELTMRVTS